MVGEAGLGGAHVSFLSAYWGLFPLALTAILQPSGRVCSLNPQFRVYLRSSPIVCMADFIGFLLRCSLHLFHGAPIRDALRQTLQHRQLHTGNERVGVRDLQEIAYARPVVFVLGVIQAIKLLASSNLPWTKTWVCCYLIPVCAFEIIALVERHLGVQCDPPQGKEVRDASRVDSLCDYLDRALCILAVYTQWLLFFICVKVPTLFQIQESGAVITKGYIAQSGLCLLLCTYLVVIIRAPDELINPAVRIVRSLFSLPPTEHTGVLLRFVVYAMGGGLTVGFHTAFPEVDVPTMLKYLGGTFLLYSALWLMAMYVADRSVLFKRDILMLTEAHRMDKCHIAFHNLLFFLGVCSLGLVGYGIGFDSSTTYKPSWAKLLG